MKKENISSFSVAKTHEIKFYQQLLTSVFSMKWEQFI